MASKIGQENLQKLLEARTTLLEKAFEAVDVDQVMAWQSKGIRFDDVSLGKFDMDYAALEAMCTENFSHMTSLRVVKSTTSGNTPEFVTWEMDIEIVNKEDEPALGIRKGQPIPLKGIAVQWWRWEGEGNEWDGDVSEKGVRGWEVLKENDYFIPART
ncbi:RuvB-like helicase 2 [Fonsecaea nubica]|uniref:RuvB-like helicase 2 n=1 Tax=Fonsecaea nubica TaxID=856822 RepID=A0A178CHG3_9EURO|nr:RuvB-like helicase 2 [Fonsecaea nubica]OAL28492.1 RuvB-like helicase 2 [Fonsecaea nubica]